MTNTDDAAPIDFLGPPPESPFYGYYRKDWVDLCDDIRHSDRAVYGVLRSLVYEARGTRNDKVFRVSLAELCHLIPGVNGKPLSLSSLRDSLRNLSHVGLVSAPDGQPLTTSSGKRAANRPVRMRVHDVPCNGYIPRWHNTEQKLEAIREIVASAKPGQKSDQVFEVGQKSDHDPRPGQGERTVYCSSCSSSLQHTPAGPSEPGSSPVGETCRVCVSKSLKTETQTPVAENPSLTTSGIDVDAFVIQVITRSMPDRLAGRLSAKNRQTIKDLVTGCLTAGHHPVVILRRVDGVCNDHTTKPMKWLSEALSELHKESPEAFPTASGDRAPKGNSAGSKCQKYFDGCVDGQLRCSEECPIGCTALHDPIGKPCPACHRSESSRSKAKVVESPAKKPTKKSTRKPTSKKSSTPQQRRTVSDEEAERARQVKLLTAQFGDPGLPPHPRQ